MTVESFGGQGAESRSVRSRSSLGTGSLWIVCVLFLIEMVCGVASAQDKPGTKLAVAQPAAKQPGKPSAAGKVKRPTRTELEVTGLTSETTDQLYTRVLYSRTNGPKKLFVRGGYSITKTRTVSAKGKVSTTQLDRYTFEGQYRRDRKRTYNFLTARTNISNRTPYSPTYGDRSGYYMISAGVGRKLTPQIEGEVGLANVFRISKDDASRIELVYSLRARSSITNSLAFDGEIHLAAPFSDDALVDSRANLTYNITPVLSLRLSYITNNLLPSPTSKTDWDRSLRLSLVFGRSSE